MPLNSIVNSLIGIRKGISLKLWGTIIALLLIVVLGLDYYLPQLLPIDLLYVACVLLSTITGSRYFVLVVGCITLILSSLVASLAPTHSFYSNSIFYQVNNALITFIIIQATFMALLLLTLRKLNKEKISAQNELQEKHSMLKLACDMAGIGSWIYKVDSAAIHWSEEIATMFEYPPGYHPSVEASFNLVAPEFQDELSNEFLAEINSGRVYDSEIQILTKSGKRVWVRIIGRGNFDRDGKLNEVIGILENIDEKKNYESSALHNQKQFEQAANALPLILWTATSTGEVDFVSKAAEDICGVPQSILSTNEGWLQVIHPEDRDAVIYIWHAAVMSGDSYSTEFRVAHADGHYEWYLTRGIPLHDNGEILKWYGSSLNIHDNKLLRLQTAQLSSRLKAVLDSMSDGFVLLDQEWRYIFVNPQAATLLEREAEKLVGQSIWDVFPDLNGSESYYQLNKAMAEGTPQLYEDYYSPLSKWFEIHIYPSEEGLAIYFQDITQRHEDEELLRLLEKAVSHLNDIVIITRADSLDLPGPSIVFVNDAFERITGYSREEAIGNSPRMLQGPHTSRSELHRIRKALEKKQPVRAELINYTKSSQEYWLELEIVPITDAKGIYTHFVSVERDITDRKQAELALKQNSQQLKISEERFRRVAQATADAIWDWDLLTDDLWWGEGMKLLFGYDLQMLETDSSSWANRIHEDDRQEVLKSIYAVIESNLNNWSHNYRFRRSDGSYAHVTDRGYVIRNISGKAIRMVGGISDITIRVELEERLRQSQRLESLGHLTGGVAHDFNNLLCVVLGNAELLNEELAPRSPSRELTEMIIMAAERGADLTKALLAFARQQPLNPRPIDVNALISNMQGMLKRTLGAHIIIEFRSTKPIRFAMIDSGQLENALLNLAINARDAMPEGGVLTIETDSVNFDEDSASLYGLTAGDYLVIAMSDTGSGISPEILPRVFEPFFTTKEKGKGTGLGLAMVYGFIKQSEGHITIHSHINQGTTITIYLPITPAHNGIQSTPESIEALPTGKEKILLVEDDPLVRRFAFDQLSRLGYRVTQAENGYQALEMLRGEDTFDLLFTDVIMPGGLNGFQLAAEALKIRNDLKIVFTSGYTANATPNSNSFDLEKTLLPKPYRSSELAKRIHEILNNNN